MINTSKCPLCNNIFLKTSILRDGKECWVYECLKSISHTIRIVFPEGSDIPLYITFHLQSNFICIWDWQNKRYNKILDPDYNLITDQVWINPDFDNIQSLISKIKTVIVFQ